MSSPTQLGTYAKFTQKQKATTLAILHVSSAATLVNWPCRRQLKLWDMAMWGTYAESIDVNVPV